MSSPPRRGSRGQIAARVAHLPAAEGVFRRGIVVRDVGEVGAVIGLEGAWSAGALTRRIGRTSASAVYFIDTEDPRTGHIVTSVRREGAKDTLAHLRDLAAGGEGSAEGRRPQAVGVTGGGFDEAEHPRDEAGQWVDKEAFGAGPGPGEPPDWRKHIPKEHLTEPGFLQPEKVAKDGPPDEARDESGKWTAGGEKPHVLFEHEALNPVEYGNMQRVKLTTANLQLLGYVGTTHTDPEHPDMEHVVHVSWLGGKNLDDAEPNRKVTPHPTELRAILREFVHRMIDLGVTTVTTNAANNNLYRKLVGLGAKVDDRWPDGRHVALPLAALASIAKAEDASDVLTEGWDWTEKDGPPDEPRDEEGKWTTGGGKAVMARGKQAVAYLRLGGPPPTPSLISQDRPWVPYRRTLGHPNTHRRTPAARRQACAPYQGSSFLDELPEFSQRVLESLRQPLEDGTVVVSRAAGSAASAASGHGRAAGWAARG